MMAMRTVTSYKMFMSHRIHTKNEKRRAKKFYCECIIPFPEKKERKKELQVHSFVTLSGIMLITLCMLSYGSLNSSVGKDIRKKFKEMYAVSCFNAKF